jgi:thiol-disulfide isomerase/thioredoxin
MPLRRREVIAAGAVAAVATATGIALGPRLDAASDSRALLATNFSDLSGRSRGLSEWKGKALVVNFWATWCAPCREEIPMLLELRAKYAHKGIEIIGIAIDQAAKVRQFSQDMKIVYPILVADHTALDLVRSLGNAPGGLPFTVVLDARGKLKHRKLGLLKQPELENWLGRVAQG